MDNNASSNKFQRPIRSFVLRQGRITPKQLYAINTYWDKYGITASNAIFDFTHIFQRAAPIILEIGFGMGHSLLTQAAAHPEYNYLGIEVHQPGIGNLLSQIHQQSLTNIRICRADAIEILQNNIADHSLSKVQIFFPDPWPKKRHHKRRLIQPEFITLISQKLIADGILHIATDWQEYAEYILTVVNENPHFTNQSSNRDYVTRPEDRPLTKFELRGKNLGHGVWDMVFKI